MNKITRAMAAVILLNMVSACTSLGTLDKNAEAPGENESIFVLGVN